MRRAFGFLMAGSLAFLLLAGLSSPAIAEDRYWRDQEVDCYEFCISGNAPNWACAVGYDLSSGCVFPEDPGSVLHGYGLCRLIGECYNRGEADQEKAACDELRQKAAEDCASNGVKDFWCSNANEWGYECRASED
jgi:hypothetical protein